MLYNEEINGVKYSVNYNVFTNKAKLYVDGREAMKVNKRTFTIPNDESGMDTYALMGNYISGMYFIKGETIIHFLPKCSPIEMIAHILPIILIGVITFTFGIVGVLPLFAVAVAGEFVTTSLRGNNKMSNLAKILINIGVLLASVIAIIPGYFIWQAVVNSIL